MTRSAEPRSPAHGFRRRETAPAVTALGVAVAALVPQLGGFDPRILGALAIYFVWITLAVSWNLVGGFAGLLNLGLVAFFGLGAMVGTACLQAGYPAVVVTVFAGMSGAALAAFLVPTFRLKGLYFAVGTFVVPYMVKPLVEVLGGGSVYKVPEGRILSPIDMYYSGLGLAALALFGVYFVMKSKAGLALRALGNDEAVAESVGVDAALYKATALVVSGFMVAVAGLYYAEIGGTVETTLFQNITFSLLPVFMVVIGGIGTYEGPVVGALIFCALNYYVTSQFPGSTLDTFVLSLSIVAFAVFRPRGVVSGLARR